MKRIALILVLISNSITGNSQDKGDASPTWEILYGSNVIFQGDTTGVPKFTDVKIDPAKDLKLTVRVHYTEKAQTDSKLVLNLMDYDGLLEKEYNGNASTTEFSFSSKWIIQFAQISGAGAEFRLQVKCKDNRAFQEPEILGILMVKKVKP